MRTLFLVLLLATAAAAQTKAPVLVELFTSEGCSSCPPADQLLIHLEKEQPVKDADIIVLGEHVDYWDGPGWHDRFSSARFTSRQEAYAAHFGIPGPYTPQMVVNGAFELVGNDQQQALKSIRAAAQSKIPAPPIVLSRDGDHLHIAISDAGKRALNVWFAITEDDLSTHVGGGENKGRDLRHTAVVRRLTRLGDTRGGRFQGDFPLALSADWRPANLRAVVFLQYGSAGEVLSAAQLSLN